MSNVTVIFDLDGTLLDTSHDLIDSLNICLSSQGLQPVTYDDVTALVGQGAIAMLKRGFQLRQYDYDDDLISQMFELFIAHYSSNMPGQSAPYPGLMDAIERLDAAGFNLAICTNKQEALARKLLDALDLTKTFSAITGGNSFSFKKPDGRHILETIKLADGDRKRAVMIGDSKNDIWAAHDANIPSIAVTFGYSDLPIADLGASKIIDHYDALTDRLVTELIDQS